MCSVFLTMKTHNSVLNKDILIKLNKHVYYDVTFSKQYTVITPFKMSAITLHF